MDAPRREAASRPGPSPGNLAAGLRGLPLAMLTGLLLIFLIGLAVGLSVRRSAERLLAAELSTIRDVDVAAIRLWLGEQAATASELAAKLADSQIAGDLLLTTTDQRPQDASPASAPLQSLAAHIPASDRYIGWALLNLDGRVVAASDARWTDGELPLSPHAWRQVGTGRATVSHPFLTPQPLSTQQRTFPAGSAMMAALAPIHRQSRILGYLALLLDPADQLAELLNAAQPGDTGETYLFDRQGRMLSASRFPNQLRELGLLSRDGTADGTLDVLVRDPQVNLTRGQTPDTPPLARPLTAMAEDATRGGTGVDARGYNDYRGVPVVGAWTWLEQYQLGVVTEIDTAEAHQPWRILRLAFWTMTGTLSAIGVMLVAHNVHSQQQQRRTAADDSQPRRLGGYELGEALGSGGMGTVYRGHHQLLRRPVAIKVLEAPGTDTRAIERFEREVQRTSELQHPNTIQIYDYGRAPDGTFYYVMELVKGLDLAQLTETYGPQPPARVVHILTQVCGSLAEAHDRGLVHRDIKPANLLLSSPAGVCDYIKVVDFGLVKDVSGVDSNAVTKVESLTGTPLYMSPEAIRDATQVDARADIYSLGAVGYYLLSGHHLFDADAPVDICMLQVGQMPPRPSKRLGRELPEDLQDLLMACLQKSVNDRPQSIAQVLEGLQRCGSNGQWSIDDAEHWWTAVHETERVNRNPLASLLEKDPVIADRVRRGSRTVAD
ncbi:serine/threonine protein kinase [Roseimaritima ulvae]|uniref:Serine/threonine-protein kinase PknB n=1 Tax=Roseimaritima ulvae TaxID=980254 RepID=A0A5B9QUT3_9BACT|nr:protein kinase [Roseimaritima ulvae]QEG41729.1 Serine/threonine-protein kinase PknB [Roseimaritima ulvae]